MRDRIASVMAIMLLALVAATSYWYSRSLNSTDASPASRLQRVDADAQSITLYQFDPQGRAQYRLAAERMTHYGDTDDADLVEPRMVSLRPEAPQLRAQSRRAHVENNGERVRLMRDVVLTRQTRDGRPPLRVTTESLVALPDQDRYTTDQPVLVERGADSIRARGMDLDNITQRAEFASEVVDTLAPQHPK